MSLADYGGDLWTPSFWDHWRSIYDTLTPSDHSALYRQFYPYSPVQKHFTLSAVTEFMQTYTPRHVIEIGGWTGDVAEACLNAFPDTYWTNFEICAEAARVFRHPRYATPPIENVFVWELPLGLGNFDALIASHSLEHMKLADVRKLLSHLPSVRSAYVDCPLRLDTVPDPWHQYEGSHILECGWHDFEAVFSEFGFDVAKRLTSPIFGESIRFFVRRP